MRVESENASPTQIFSAHELLGALECRRSRFNAALCDRSMPQGEQKANLKRAKRRAIENFEEPHAGAKKQMRPGPATQAALLSRTLLTAVFRPKVEDHRAAAFRRTPCSNAHRGLAPLACYSVSFVLLGRRTMEEAATAGHQLTGHDLDFHRQLTLERIAGNTEHGQQRFRNILAL